MILTILLAICIGFNLGGVAYYNGAFKSEFKIGYGFTLIICLIALISRF